MRLSAPLFVASALALGCQPETSLKDLSKLAAGERDNAQSNWARVEMAFKANDWAALQNLVGRIMCRIQPGHRAPVAIGVSCGRRR
jgi:hypothetical protein